MSFDRPVVVNPEDYERLKEAGFDLAGYVPATYTKATQPEVRPNRKQRRLAKKMPS